MDAIVQQCNCLAFKAHRLSEAIARKYSWGNPYRLRRCPGIRNLAVPQDRVEPGTIQIMKHPSGDRPDVIVLYAQWDFGTGRVNRIPTHEDTPAQREKWFQQCTRDFKGFQNFAFPYQIGCGLAGGNWTHYQTMIEDFSVKFHKHVTLVLKKC